MRGLVRRAAAALPEAWYESRLVRLLLGESYADLSYVLDWRDAFLGSPRLRADVANINNALEYRAALARVRDYELIVTLHSAGGDALGPLRRASAALAGRRGRLVVFPGNEYSLLDEKLAFIRETGADVVASQLPRPAAEWLYRDAGGARLVLAPAALNPDVYRADGSPRTVDLGFRGDRYSLAIGDRERSDLIDAVARSGPARGLTVDVEYRRYTRHRWVDFLRRSRGLVGAEAGTAYLDRDGQTYLAATAYLTDHPDARLEDLHERFFRRHPAPVSGKAISSRHFEAIGTGTCQLLLEGHYNGILVAGEHYIAVKRDLSDLDDALDRFRDPAYRSTVVERARELALARHTYRHRVEHVLRAALEG